MFLSGAHLSGTRRCVDQLTPAQARVLDAIRARFDAGQASPTYRELQQQLGFGSTATVRDHLRALERKGFLSLGEGRFRSLRLVRDTVESVRIPVVGQVVAEMEPVSDDGTRRFVAVPAPWIRGDMIAVRVHGDSMKEAGLLDGDIALIRRDLTPKSGQVVCAIIDGNATLKTLEVGPGGCLLVPANSDYVSVRLEEITSVVGVLITSIRQYSVQTNELCGSNIPSNVTGILQASPAADSHSEIPR